MTNEELYNKVETFIRQQEQFGETIFIDEELIGKQRENQYISLEAEQMPDNHDKKGVVIDDDIDMFEEVPDWKLCNTIPDLYLKINKCQKCDLAKSRTNFVFGSGNPNADIMIIGEAPGNEEDLQGLPFVGRAGQLLTKILEAINLSRDEVFICNILKCRPPQNRNPLPVEVEQCEPYLKKQIEIIKPVFILALGLTAVDTLLKSKNKMAETRGKVMNYHGIKMLVTYHPAALLRNPNWKRETWEDVKLLRRMYDEYLKERK